MATGYLGTSGVNTYFKDGPISLGVTLDSNIYQNGTITFNDASGLTLTWDDQKEHVADGTIFVYAS